MKMNQSVKLLDLVVILESSAYLASSCSCPLYTAMAVRNEGLIRPAYAASRLTFSKGVSPIFPDMRTYIMMI